MPNYHLSHLDQLEAEAIFILRETAAQFENPALLFSGGKDSIVMAWLARKAFWPARMPFPLVHIDTGHNFQETMTYRDEFVDLIRANLVVGSVQESIDTGRVVEEKGPNASRNKLQTVTLLDTIEKNQYDACLGGGRRDEEKARAKERFFSHRDDFGQWDPKNQRPELWNLFNGRKNPGEHFRVFPLSNFTEMDIWMYIKREKIPLPSIYFAHEREVFERNGSLLAVTDFLKPQDHEAVDPQDRPLPHHRRRHLHRCRRIHRLQPRRSHRRSRRRPPNRTRHPLRRQTLRNRHGRPEEGRILLSKS